MTFRLSGNSRRISLLIIYSIVMTALFLTIFIFGCSKKSTNSDSSLVGTWELTEEYYGGEWYDTEDNETITFNSNYTGVVFFEDEEANFTWSISGNTLTVNVEGEGPESVTFSIGGNTLIITDILEGEVFKFKYVRV